MSDGRGVVNDGRGVVNEGRGAVSRELPGPSEKGGANWLYRQAVHVSPIVKTVGGVSENKTQASVSQVLLLPAPALLSPASPASPALPAARHALLPASPASPAWTASSASPTYSVSPFSRRLACRQSCLPHLFSLAWPVSIVSPVSPASLFSPASAVSPVSSVQVARQAQSSYHC